MVTAAQRRRAVAHLTRRRISSARRAGRRVAWSCSVAQYRRLGRNDAVLCTRLRALAQAYPHYGYPTLPEMLKTEGRVINRKRTYRRYREERLQVRYLSGASSWRERAPRCACQARSMNDGRSTACQISSPMADACASSMSSTTIPASASCSSLTARSRDSAWLMHALNAHTVGDCQRHWSATMGRH
jgi:hypothetical protein